MAPVLTNLKLHDDGNMAGTDEGEFNRVVWAMVEELHRGACTAVPPFGGTPPRKGAHRILVNLRVGKAVRIL